MLFAHGQNVCEQVRHKAEMLVAPKTRNAVKENGLSCCCKSMTRIRYIKGSATFQRLLDQLLRL